MEKNIKDYRKSALLQHIETILSMESQLKQASMAAFVALAEQDQTIDAWEIEHGEGQNETNGELSISKAGLSKHLRRVSKSMRVNNPSDKEVDAIMDEIDGDGNGTIDADEFYELTKIMLLKMKESEEELEDRINKQIEPSSDKK